MGSEESRSHKHQRNKSFVVREVPIRRTKSFPEMEMEKAMMMDYDSPELVVFLQEDRTAASAEHKCVTEDCECHEAAAETMSCSSVSKVSDSACRNHRTSKCGFRNNMVMMMAEGDHPTEGREEEEEMKLFDRRKNEEWCWCTSRSGSGSGSMDASHGSSDSSSGSAHSFAFPILQREWSGSPVRMAQPHSDSSSSTRLRWRYILCPCCKC